MRAIQLHPAGAVQAHQRLALTTSFVANAKAIRLNVPLVKSASGTAIAVGLLASVPLLSPSSPWRVLSSVT